MVRPEITFEELRADTRDLTNSAWQSVYKQTQKRDVGFTKQEFEAKVLPQVLEATRRFEGDRSR